MADHNPRPNDPRWGRLAETGEGSVVWFCLGSVTSICFAEVGLEEETRLKAQPDTRFQVLGLASNAVFRGCHDSDSCWSSPEIIDRKEGSAKDGGNRNAPRERSLRTTGLVCRKGHLVS